MSLKNWSTTAASNATVDSINFAEGQAPSTVNDSARALMADVRYALATQDTIASATTTDIGAKDSGSLTVSGTTTITGLGTVSAGISKRLTFSGALTLTHNATSLILPGAANITTAAGDSCVAESLGSGNWKIHSYQRASGQPVSPVLATNVATFLATPSSANLAAALTDETGSGAAVFATSPTLVTPTLGAATATSINFGETALNYYGEGTWTPSLGGNTTYSTQSGIYTRVGRLIDCQCDLAVTTLGTGSTTTISGLPFTVNGTASGRVGTFSTLAVNVLGFWAYAVSTILTFQSLTAAGTSATNQPAIFGNSASVRCGVTFHI
jgi:hypothetical protein